MPNDNDVNALFRRFGGDVSTYQEVVAEQQVEAAVGRWPILNQINPLVRRLSSAGDVSPNAVSAPQTHTRTHRPVSEPLAGGVAAPVPPVVGPAPSVAPRGIGGASWLGSANTAAPASVAAASAMRQQGHGALPRAEGEAISSWVSPGRAGGQAQGMPAVSHGDTQSRAAGSWGGGDVPLQRGQPEAGLSVRSSETAPPSKGAQAGLKALFSRIVSQKSLSTSKATGTSASVQGKW